MHLKETHHIPQQWYPEPVAMSQELVPLTYDRAIYNQMHGTALEHHGDQLTHEQAKRINDTFDIQVNLGRHGIPAFMASSVAEAAWGTPKEYDYDATAAVVADMQPGDTLYVEGYGFKDARDSMSPNHGDAHLDMMGTLIRKTNLEILRSTGNISAFQYAAELAAIGGVRTVYADQDTFDQQRNEAMADGKTSGQLWSGLNSDERDMAERIDAQRGRRAVCVLKDDALAQLPPEGTAVQHGHKPRLVMLFGRAHAPEISEAVNDMGLNATIHMRPTDGARTDV